MYNDIFIEQNLNREIKKTDKFLRIICICIIVALAIVYFTTFSIQVLAVLGVAVVLTLFVYLNTRFAYDYTLTGDELDFTRIRNGRWSKLVVNVDISQGLEVLAPSKSQPVEQYVGKAMPTFDLTSHREGVPYYTMIAKNTITQRTTKILFEPNEEMLDAIYNFQPRKVFK